MSYVYKNLSNLPLTIPNVGVVEAGGTIEAATRLENAYLEEVTGNSPQIKEEKK